MLIRDARLLDASSISRLVCDSAREHIGPTLSSNGTENLLSRMNVAAIESFMRGEFRFFLAEDRGSLVGLSAVKLPSHLYYLFVKTAFHRRGIGRQLWLQARDWILETYDSDAITVNSSLNAVSIYAKLGFAPDGDVLEKNEVKFQPMRWSRAAEHVASRRTTDGVC
jgi:GNAT superfamily N-acetyltransferase